MRSDRIQNGDRAGPVRRVPLPLVPGALAWSVVEEAEAALGHPLRGRAGYVRALVIHAEEVTGANTAFRRRVAGAQGREYLAAFMRHWLAAKLLARQPVTFRRLPLGFATGRQAADSSQRQPAIPEPAKNPA